MTNDQLILNFLEEMQSRNFSPHTIRGYERAVRDFSRYLDAQSLLKVDRHILRDYFRQFEGGKLSPVTVAGHRYALSSFYDFLKREKLVSENPVKLLEPLKHVESPLPRFLAVCDVEKMIESAESLRDKTVIEFLFDTAARVSELVGCRVEDVDFESGEILLHGKGSKDRIAPLSSILAQGLREYLKGRDTGYLFQPERDTDSRRLGTRAVARIVKKAARHAGLEGVHPHTFRHSAATAMLEAGMDIRYLCELLGHASIVTTQKYTHLSTAHLRQVMERCHPRWNLEAEPSKAPQEPEPKQEEVTGE